MFMTVHILSYYDGKSTLHTACLKVKVIVKYYATKCVLIKLFQNVRGCMGKLH